jgi:hypothetical protein
MSEENHKIIAWIEDFTGDGEAEAAMRRRFALMNDGQRVADLQNISTWLRDESASIRQRSQLMALGRSLNELHQAMRKAGR